MDFLDNHFKNRKFFSFIYGSYAYGTQKVSSDLDIIICVDEKLDNDISECVSYVTDLHIKYGMNMDYEIQHKNKLVVEYKFLHDAVSGLGFMGDDGQFCIPEIIKTKEYLNSKYLLLRFFLDSMVHKHIFLTGNESDYIQLRQHAVENLARIIATCKNIEKTSAANLAKEFIYNDVVTGDYYLGFEDKPYYHVYLTSLFSDLFQRLLSENKVSLDNDNPGFYIFKENWSLKNLSVNLK